MDAAASARVLSSKPVNIQGGSYNPGSRGWGAGGTWADAVRNGAAPGSPGGGGGKACERRASPDSPAAAASPATSPPHSPELDRAATLSSSSERGESLPFSPREAPYEGRGRALSAGSGATAIQRRWRGWLARRDMALSQSMSSGLIPTGISPRLDREVEQAFAFVELNDESDLTTEEEEEDEEDEVDDEEDPDPAYDEDLDITEGLDSICLEAAEPQAGEPGWLLNQLLETPCVHTCKAGFLQLGMECHRPLPSPADPTCKPNGAAHFSDIELPPEGWETRTSRRDGRPYFYNVATGESRWPRQRRSASDRELAAARCAACRTEWIQMHDGSQHKTQPTADEAIERAHQRLYADNNARRTLAYQLLAFAASAQPRLGGAVMPALAKLPFDLHEKIATTLNWRWVAAAAASQFVKEGWAWAPTATMVLRSPFSLGAATPSPALTAGGKQSRSSKLARAKRRAGKARARGGRS